MDDSIDSGNFSVGGNLPLIQNNYVTHMHGLPVYVKEGLPSIQDFSRKLCRLLLIVSTTLLFNVLLLFPLLITLFIAMHGF